MSDTEQIRKAIKSVAADLVWAGIYAERARPERQSEIRIEAINVGTDAILAHLALAFAQARADAIEEAALVAEAAAAERDTRLAEIRAEATGNDESGRAAQLCLVTALVSLEQTAKDIRALAAMSTPSTRPADVSTDRDFIDMTGGAA